ncbi:MAG: phosphatase PAP2 family protein [Nitrospirae bacterium]|nr:MAG: phosphatase PAP2 family protein [Nitrospirota bacterium]
MERFYNPYLTDLLIIGYCTYYFMPVILGVILKIQGKEKEFQEGLFTVLLCFYLSYVGYVLFPALGPRYTMLHLQQKPLEGVFLFDGINHLLNSLERIKRDAFPSGHTGITLVVLYLAMKFERRLLWAFVPCTMLLIIATIYCRFHYGVDILGGVLLTGITILTVRVLYK